MVQTQFLINGPCWIRWSTDKEGEKENKLLQVLCFHLYTPLFLNFGCLSSWKSVLRLKKMYANAKKALAGKNNPWSAESRHPGCNNASINSIKLNYFQSCQQISLWICCVITEMNAPLIHFLLRVHAADTDDWNVVERSHYFERKQYVVLLSTLAVVDQRW